jgi:hypothetical protein
MLNSNRPAALSSEKAVAVNTYFEIYEPLLEGQCSATVQIHMRIFDSRTGEVISDSQPISAAPYAKAGSSTIPAGRGMDISKLPIIGWTFRRVTQQEKSRGAQRISRW